MELKQGTQLRHKQNQDDEPLVLVVEEKSVLVYDQDGDKKILALCDVEKDYEVVGHIPVDEIYDLLNS